MSYLKLLCCGLDWLGKRCVGDLGGAGAEGKGIRCSGVASRVSLSSSSF